MAEKRAPHYEIVVVGAGQAGLALGYFLAKRRRRFAILERATSVGAAWHDRWDSLTLFTPRRYDSLPGLPFPGDPDGYPGRDEVIGYLERYAAEVELPIELESGIRKLSSQDGSLVVEVDDGTITADQVVVATGPFQAPFVPDFATKLDADVVQMHSTGYRSSGDVPEGTALVVGGGNTGFQIAKELAGTNTVQLSISSRQKALRQRILHRDIFWWLTKTRLLGVTADSRLGQRLRNRDTLIGSSSRELRRRYGVPTRPRAVDASGRTVRFEDGTELEVDAVIWATGYRPDYGWIDLPVFDEGGRPRHRRGVTDVPGLYFLGLTWQNTRGSALLGWVKDDAEFIAGEIEAQAGTLADPGERAAA